MIYIEGDQSGNQHIDGPCPLGPKETYGLFVPPGKAYTLLTDHLIIGLPLMSVPA